MTQYQVINSVKDCLNVSTEEATKIIEKAIAGQEITQGINYETWLNRRFLPNCVFIDEEGYTRMCIDALKILSRTAATDYGGSRQRDMGQLWADMTRGYLGELAFLLFLKKKWDIEGELGHEVGALEDFLPMDIHRIRRDQGEFHIPRLKISLKTTKWNGIWLDIPGDQFNHSDVHVLIKVGTGRDHLFAFFKKISVFKDKVLKRGIDMGCLTTEESNNLFDKLPSFKPIPAYICGFVLKEGSYSNIPYTGKKGRKNYTITGWNGKIGPGDIETIKRRENITGSIKFEGIGSFAHDSGYLFNTGNLIWKNEDWEEVMNKI